MIARLYTTIHGGGKRVLGSGYWMLDIRVSRRLKGETAESLKLKV